MSKLQSITCEPTFTGPGWSTRRFRASRGTSSRPTASRARYEHLPIYKAALDAAVHFENVVAGFSRYHKYTLGTELRNASRLVVKQVIRANSARERLPELIRLRDGWNGCWC